MMDADADQPPLIIFDEADDESADFNSAQDQPSKNSVFSTEEIVSQATVSFCDGSGSQGLLELDSTGHEDASGSERTADLDASGMEDMIQKILEKYGETEEQGGGVATLGRARTTSQDGLKQTGEADSSVSDMIQRESSKWDRVYGTEDNRASVSTRDSAGGQEIGGRRTVKEDAVNDHVEIGSVIRSQTGVAKQLISVSEGLDEVNDDLEEMKRELKRIQAKAYTCLEGGDLLDGGGQTSQEFNPLGGSKDADIYRRKNEWIEEREGVVRFDDGNSVQQPERYWSTHQSPASYLPDVGRSHIKESHTNLTHLLTIAEPVQPYRQTRSVIDGGTESVRRDRHLDLDRFGRPLTQLNSVEESSWKPDDSRWRVKGSQRRLDGYCYMCEEFGDVVTGRKNVSTYDEPSLVVRRPHDHTYSSMPTYDDPPMAIQRDRNQRYKSVPSYDEPSNVDYRDQTYRPLSITDLDLNSNHRSREDFGGIYKTSSGVYFYSDDVRSYPEETVPDPAGIARSFVRHSSIPRGFQSQSQSVDVQRSPSQIRRPSVEFTSKFLTNVRRRNSLGGRTDTGGYRSLTLKGY